MYELSIYALGHKGSLSVIGGLKSGEPQLYSSVYITIIAQPSGLHMCLQGKI